MKSLQHKAKHAFDYSFTFGEVGPTTTFVEVSNHRNGSSYTIGVDIDNADLFRFVRRGEADTLRAADALTLAVCVSVADRMAVRHEDEVCRIHITAPAWFPEIMGEETFEMKLREALHYATDDEWTFEWVRRECRFEKPATQIELPLEHDIEVALWSGGMDSAAGLWQRYKKNSASSYVLLGSGGDLCVLGVQKQVFRQANSIMKERAALLQVPIHMRNAKDLPKNSDGRARGFVFTLIGGVCAYLQGQQRLHVYENGFGAFNLPYSAAEVGLDHARSVHPSSLWNMSQLLQSLFCADIEIRNPFEFQTKAQMCQGFDELALIAPHFVFGTVSCDSRHRMKDLPAQCGYCTSCLLRRQALAANGIADKTPYVVGRKSLDSHHAYPLRAMLHQVETLRRCLAAPDKWGAFLYQFPQIQEAMTPYLVQHAGGQQAAQSKILGHYERYCQEWDIARPIVSKGLPLSL